MLNLWDWWRQKRINRAQQRYEEGRAYALAGLYNGELSEDMLRERTDEASIFGDFDAYDAGILDGIKQYKEDTEHA